MTTSTRTITDLTRSRPCLACEQPCRSEGQLCPACCEAGHYVTDDTVVVNLEIRLPESLRH